jgi:hypothetical protein
MTDMLQAMREVCSTLRPQKGCTTKVSVLQGAAVAAGTLTVVLAPE